MKEKPIPEWKAEPFMFRAAKCKLFLYVHGLLTDAESQKVAGRILKEQKRREADA